MSKSNKITKFIDSHSRVEINQKDLSKLNDTASNIFYKYDFTTPEQMGATLGISPELSQLIIILLELPKLNKSTSELDLIRDQLRSKLTLIPHEYEKKVLSSKPAPVSTTLKQAIDQGYSFKISQYERDLKIFLNYNYSPKALLRAFVKTLQKYPDTYSIFREYKDVEQNVARMIIELIYKTKPYYVQVLYTYATNKVLDFFENSREKRIRHLDGYYLDALRKIYNKYNVSEIIKEPENPIEAYLPEIKEVDLDDLPSLVSNFGMSIPEHVRNNKKGLRFYVLSRMYEYKDVLTREQNPPPLEKIIQGVNSEEHLFERLGVYSDFEIMDFFGYMGGFNSRANLIENIYVTISEGGFILFQDYDQTRAMNVETTLGTDLDFIEPPYLVFGTPLEYRVLELDELNEAFRSNDSTVFKKIGDEQPSYYKTYQISRLRLILMSMKSTNPELEELVDQVLNKIHIGISANLKRDDVIDEFIDGVYYESQEIKNTFYDFFKYTFQAGMYMKGWKGPGNDYPVNTIYDRSSFKIPPESIMALGKALQKYSDLDEKNRQALRKLPEVGYQNQGNVVIDLDYFIDLVESLNSGETCVYMSSRRLVTSSHYYLSVVFPHHSGKVVNNFNPSNLEYLS